jgi:hypothetical protein
MTGTATLGPRSRHAPSECGQALTIVARVRSKPGVDALRALLGEMGEDAARNPVVPFGRSPSTHFARWVLVDTPGTAPLLAFESNFDGSVEEYLDELLEIGGPGIARIYSYVEGDTVGNLKAFLLAHRLPYQAFYRAYPERSVADVLQVLEIRSLILQYLDSNRGDLGQKSAVEIHASVRQMLRDRGIADLSFPPVRGWKIESVTTLLQDFIGPPGPARSKARRVFGLVAAVPVVVLGLLEMVFGAAVLHLFGVAVVVLVLVALALVLRIREVEKIPDRGTRPPAFADSQFLEGQEDVAVQNQLTHVAIVKPGEFRKALLRGVLFVINLAAHRVFVDGNLGGIPSIHFARWVILEDGRLLFFSNFDGTWDSYLGDFIDKASAGLSSVWSNTEWFPPTEYLVWGGAQDADDFKQWARERQLPMQVWYTAYPRYSVQNIRKAFPSAQQATSQLSPQEAAAWLSNLG